MATVVKTWVFAADAEGLVDVGDSAVLGSSWSAADGNPAGSIEWQQFSGGTGTERARRSGTGQTWETWGVPAGATVTSVQVTAWDYLVWSASGMSAERLRFRIVGSGGTTVHSAGELVDDTTIHAADGGTPHAGAVGTSRAVDGGSQGSTTDVRFEIEVGCTASGTPNIDYEQDNIQLTITYTAAAAGGAPPGNRPILFMLQRFRAGVAPGFLAFPQPSVGGPATFAQSLDATVTSTASIHWSVGKVMTATSTSTATIVRTVGKSLTGNSTSTATIVKSVGKKMTANATVTAVLVALKAALLTMTATVTSTASIVKSVGKPVTATVTSTASMVRQVGKTMSATATSTASIVKSVGKKITANATVTATLSAIKAVLLTMTATVTSTATIRRSVGKGMTATATSTATISRQVGKQIVATVTSSATIVKQVGKKLTATVTTVGSLIGTFVAGGAVAIFKRFFGRPSPSAAVRMSSPSAHTESGSPSARSFGSGSPEADTAGSDPIFGGVGDYLGDE